MSESAQSADILGQQALTYLDSLYSYAMSLCRNQTEAEDLVQDTYEHAVRAFGQLANDSNLKSWLYTIMRNIWLNKVRHDHTLRMVDIDDEEGSRAVSEVMAGSDPYSSYLSQAECMDVRAAIGNLPPLYREVIVLREFEDFTYQEIGEILRIPAGTVMSRLARARDKLRQALGQWDRNSTATGSLKPGEQPT